MIARPTTLPTVALVGPDPLVEAWTVAFREVSGVQVIAGDILHQPPGTALVSPANSYGMMRGGLDYQYAMNYAEHAIDIEHRVREVIAAEWGGELPVGSAVVVATPEHPRWPCLIVAPTMRTPGNIAHTDNAYHAFRAALLAVMAWNRQHPDRIVGRVACPGMGTGVGGLMPQAAATRMRAAWDAVVNEEGPCGQSGAGTHG